jgi:hypothetical protein
MMFYKKRRSVYNISLNHPFYLMIQFADFFEKSVSFSQPALRQTLKDHNFNTCSHQNLKRKAAQ